MNRGLWSTSAVELAAMIRAREVSCVEVMESVLGRIAAHNGRINAIVDDRAGEALQAAERKDREVGGGASLGPLHGVPVTVKENVDVAGQPTTNGLPAFADLIAPDHSPVVRNLLDAGAVIVGRTNTPELSMRGTTDNPLRGRTLNPWDEEASPGGSSGGAAAAAAMGFGPIHHGNDIGGSLRFPSFACGVATVKPTFGRVPAFNPSASAERGLLAQLISVQGAICREVRDVRLATRVLAGGDPRDPWWVPVPFDGPPLAPPVRGCGDHRDARLSHPSADSRRHRPRGGDARRCRLRGGARGDSVDHEAGAGVVRRAGERDRPLSRPVRARARQRDHPDRLRALPADRRARRPGRISPGHRRPGRHDPRVERLPRPVSTGAVPVPDALDVRMGLRRAGVRADIGHVPLRHLQHRGQLPEPAGGGGAGRIRGTNARRACRSSGAGSARI